MERKFTHLVVFAALWGCSANDEGGVEGAGGHDHGIAIEREATPMACGNANISTFTVAANSSRILHPSTTHLCWLGEVMGDGKNNPRTTLMHDQALWQASTYSEGGQSTSTFYCAPHACFFSDNPGYDVTWMGDDAVVGANATTDCRLSTAQAWQADATTMLNGLEGQGVAHGHVWNIWDYAYVILKNNPALLTPVQEQDCLIDTYSRNASFLSYFVGVPGGTHYAVYKGPNSTRSWGIANAGTYGSYSNDSSFERSMAFVDEGICFFTRLGGDFRGPTEYAKILKRYVPQAGRYQWVLRTGQGTAIPNYIQASAACYLYDQSQGH